MASIINASNTSGLVFTSDMSGVLQLQQNGVALPALSVAPAFSAYQSNAQTIGASFTKVQYQTESYDTNSNFDSTTNYRFTPTVAGYYFFNAELWASSGAVSVQPAFYKNGSVVQYGAYLTQTSIITGLFYMNGSTDYMEVYGYISSSTALSTGPERNFFQAFLARGA